MSCHAIELAVDDRSKIIGGSEVPAIMGYYSKFKASDVYASKKGLIPPMEPNVAMEIGKFLEPKAIEFYRREMPDAKNDRAILFRDNIAYADDEFPWMIAHMDGLTVPRASINPEWKKITEVDQAMTALESATNGVEIKTANIGMTEAWGEPWTDEIPEAAMCQIQFYMKIAGLPYFHLPAILAGRNYGTYEVRRNQPFIDVITDAVREFKDHLDRDIIPEVDFSDSYSKLLTARYPKDDGTVIEEVPTDIHIAVMTAIDVATQLKELEKIGVYNKNIIKKFMETAARVIHPRYRISFKKTKDTSKIDYESLSRSIYDLLKDVASGSIKTYGEMVKLYTNTVSGYRMFRITPTKPKKEKE